MRSPCLALVLAALLGASTASAGLYQDIYRGLQYATTPTGPIQTTSDGIKVNGGRSGAVRILPNRLGKGWTV